MAKTVIKIDMDAIRNVFEDAFDAFLAEDGIEYGCPGCGTPLTVTTGENVCPECGFVITVERGELEL